MARITPNIYSKDCIEHLFRIGIIRSVVESPDDLTLIDTVFLSETNFQAAC